MTNTVFAISADMNFQKLKLIQIHVHYVDSTIPLKQNIVSNAVLHYSLSNNLKKQTPVISVRLLFKKRLFKDHPNRGKTGQADG